MKGGGRSAVGIEGMENRSFGTPNEKAKRLEIKGCNLNLTTPSIHDK